MPPQLDPDLTRLHESAELADTTDLPSSDTGTGAGETAASLLELPGFVVHRELARGGMGAVYLATDTRLKRSVAVKTLLPGRTAETAIRQFHREAEITARLAHPGIPPVHEAGSLSDGRPYLAMKLIEGRTLSEQLRKRADPTSELPRFLQVFEQVCQTVGYAHRQGVIHRDLKPANVMVGAFGEVQVMDWGLAKKTAAEVGVEGESAEPAPTDTSEEQTRAGVAKGTPAYMAPEQAAGRIEEVGPPADVFALGGLLCVILTGAPPYAGTDGLVLLHRAAAGDVTEAHDRLTRCGADPELVALAKRCLSANAADRFADAGEVAEAVAAYRSAVEARLRQAEAERAAATVQLREQRKRRRVQFALFAVIVLVVLGSAGAVWWDERKQVLAEREKAADARARRDKFAADLDAADAELKADRPVAATKLLAELTPRTAEADVELLLRWGRRKEDAELLQRLDRVQDGFHRMTRFRVPAAIDWPDGEYAAAFRECGFHVGKDDPAAVAKLVSESPSAERIRAGLDEWLAVSGNHDDRAALLTVLASVDPEPDRTRARELMHDWADPQKRARFIRLLAAKPVWTPRFWAALAKCRTIRDDFDTYILGVGHELHPGNPDLHEASALVYCRQLMTEAYDPDAKANALFVERQEKIRELARRPLPHYKAALAARPDRPRMWQNYGVALLKAGDEAGAQAALRTAIERGPALPDAYLSMTELKLEPAELVSVLRQGLRSMSSALDSAVLNRKLGVLLFDRDRPAADAAFRQVLTAFPNDVVACTRLGVLLRLDGKLEESEAVLRFAIEDASRNFELACATGATAFDRKKYSEATTMFRHAARLNVKSPLAHHMFGRALYEDKKFKEAADAQAAAIKANAGYAPAHFHKMLAHERLSQWKEAVESARAYVFCAPDDPLGPNSLAHLLIREGNPEEALNKLVAAFAKKPQWEKDPALPLRVTAARAALAYSVQVLDGPADDKERTKLRKQAYDWLTADLAATEAFCKTALEPADIAVSAKQGGFPLVAEFGVVRDAKKLEKLPADERKRWADFWAGAARLAKERPLPPGVFRTL